MTSTANMKKLRDDLFFTEKDAPDANISVLERTSSLREKGVLVRRRKNVSFADEEGRSLVQTSKIRRECSDAYTSNSTENLQRSRVKNIKHSDEFKQGVCLESTLTSHNSVVGTILLEEASSSSKSLIVYYCWNNNKKYSSATPCCLTANRYFFKIKAPKRTKISGTQIDNKLKFFVNYEGRRIDNNGKHFIVEWPSEGLAS